MDMLACLPILAAAALLNPPIGPHTGLTDAGFAGAASFTNGQRIVVTPYFYWYDAPSGAHIRDPDGTDALTTHPPTLAGLSFASSDWHRRQLLDMLDAGIDAALPVFWGEPSQRRPGRPVAEQPWSFAGIPPLVAAREARFANGQNGGADFRLTVAAEPFRIRCVAVERPHGER